MILSGHEGAAAGAANMARDLELASDVEHGRLNVAFRTYAWNPWTISLGKHQTRESIRANLAEQRGYDIVQRPTGGRAVFHAEEITYALAVRSTQPKVVYQQIHELLLSALSHLVPGQLNHTVKPTDLREHYASSGALGTACFTAHAPTEIMADGRKVVGSAQRVLPSGVILQHGSILLGPAHLEVAELIGQTPEETRRLREALQRAAVSLSELVSNSVSVRDAATAIHDVVTADTLRNLM